MDFATKQRLPVVPGHPELVEAGGLMSFGASYPGMHRRAAYFVDRILKGAKPADLPVERPAKFELVIKPQDRQGPGPYDPAVAARAGGSGHRIVDRRRFLLTSLAGALAAPLAPEAQQAARVARIGYLAANLAASPHMREAFLQGLRDLGYVEGGNVVIEYRSAEGKLERLPALAAELIALKVDVILAGGTPQTLAAKQATKTIPIVFAAAADAVGSGIIPSLARPGGNVTGLSFLAPELVGKCLELLKQAVPGVSRVAVLWHPGALG
jgi:ABC-type uncharacterized transport system substrate-binding protein